MGIRREAAESVRDVDQACHARRGFERVMTPRGMTRHVSTADAAEALTAAEAAIVSAVIAGLMS